MILDKDGYNNFNDKDGLWFWIYSKPGAYKIGTRENAKDGTVRVNNITNGSVYLCFRNPSPTQGTFVILEVSAIVETEQYLDEWTLENKEYFYENCLKLYFINITKETLLIISY